MPSGITLSCGVWQLCIVSHVPAVYAKDLKFLPMGSQMPNETGCRFAVGQQQMLPKGVQPVNDDILVAKLRPGQIIDLEAHCIKGTLLYVPTSHAGVWAYPALTLS